MTIKTPEDDEFDRIAKESGWRKQQISQQASLQEKYDEAIYLLREAKHALDSCVILDSDKSDKDLYYFNADFVEDALKIIDEYLQQNG